MYFMLTNIMHRNEHTTDFKLFFLFIRLYENDLHSNTSTFIRLFFLFCFKESETATKISKTSEKLFPSKPDDDLKIIHRQKPYPGVL